MLQYCAEVLVSHFFSFFFYHFCLFISYLLHSCLKKEQTVNLKALEVKAKHFLSWWIFSLSVRLCARAHTSLRWSVPLYWFSGRCLTIMHRFLLHAVDLDRRVYESTPVFKRNHFPSAPQTASYSHTALSGCAWVHVRHIYIRMKGTCPGKERPVLGADSKMNHLHVISS